MRNKYNGLIKIGYTSNITNRLKEIKSICKNYLGENDAIELLGLIDTSFIKPVEFEHFLHKRYKEYNTFGEWFKFPDSIWKEIEEEYLFDFEYDDTIYYSDLKNLKLRRNQIHGIGFVGSPNDEEFIKFLYGRYQNKYKSNKTDIQEIASQLIQDIFGIKCVTIYNRIFNKSFYNYVFQRYLENLSKKFCAMCEAYRQSPSEMLQQTTPVDNLKKSKLSKYTYGQ